MSSTQRCKSTYLCNKRLLLEKQSTRGTVGFLCTQRSKPTALSEPICHPIKQSAQEAASPLRTWTGQSRGQPVNTVPLCISTPCRSTSTSKESFVNNAARCLRFHASRQHFKNCVFVSAGSALSRCQILSLAFLRTFFAASVLVQLHIN